MSKVIADITMSLDGYVTGPLADSQHGRVLRLTSCPTFGF